jgi:hypothetical protein
MIEIEKIVYQVYDLNKDEINVIKEVSLWQTLSLKLRKL